MSIDHSLCYTEWEVRNEWESAQVLSDFSPFLIPFTDEMLEQLNILVSLNTCCLGLNLDLGTNFKMKVLSS